MPLRLRLVFGVFSFPQHHRALRPIGTGKGLAVPAKLGDLKPKAPPPAKGQRAR